MFGQRSFAGPSALDERGLSLGLAPALTPQGLDHDPHFFTGFAMRPTVLARGLLTLADITATRYFQYTPTSQRDPVLTANGDRLRAECFSACNGVYARLDLLAPGFDGGDIQHGTTNVDLGAEIRALLAGLGRTELLHLRVGSDGLHAATPDTQAAERPVNMPDRWVRALGNLAEGHRALSPVLQLGAVDARALLAQAPAASAADKTLWLTPARSGLRIGTRPGAAAIALPGPHRLSAAKRLLTHVLGAVIYAGDAGDVALELRLPDARLTLGFTAESWRGHSGEGALLGQLAAPERLADAELVSALLAYEPVIDLGRLQRDSGLSAERASGALAVLAASGRVGWDLHDGAHFHRELPDHPDRVTRDQPRLVRARSIVAEGRVSATGPGEWTVAGSEGSLDTLVRTSGDAPSCSCAWFLRHGSGRGPCAHLLAVQLFTREPHG